MRLLIALPLLLLLVLFTLSSVGCALARDVGELIALRFLQALGGCAPLVVPRAIVRDYFDQRGSARMLWRLKRWAPLFFLRRVLALRERIRAAQANPPQA